MGGNFKALPRVYAKGVMGELEKKIVQLSQFMERKYTQHGIKEFEEDQRENQTTLQDVIFFSEIVSLSWLNVFSTFLPPLFTSSTKSPNLLVLLLDLAHLPKHPPLPAIHLPGFPP